MQVLLIVSVWICGFNLFLKCVISQELIRECTYTVKVMFSVLYVFIWWDLVPTAPWEKLYPVPTAMLIVTMISIRAHSVLKTVSIGNRFPWHNINCFQSPWFQCIITESGIFPWWVSKEGGLPVSKERGDIKKWGGWKKKRGLIHLSMLWNQVVWKQMLHFHSKMSTFSWGKWVGKRRMT